MSESTPEKKSPVTKFFQFDPIARIIGFVVDVITLLSLLFAIRLNSVDLPSFITPALALGIWCIASYTYLAYLHRYWEMKMLEKQFHRRFGTFLVGDLVLHFRSPFVLLPAFVLIIILVAILASNPTTISLSVILGVVLVPLLLILGGGYVLRVRAELEEEENESKNEKERNRARSFVDENWTSLRKRIKQELETKQWIDARSLSDIAMVQGIDDSALTYGLAKYATENAITVKYGYVRRRTDNRVVSGYQKVLIYLQNLNHDNYFYSDHFYD